jgi:hypothetical protein
MAQIKFGKFGYFFHPPELDVIKRFYIRNLQKLAKVKMFAPCKLFSAE